MRLEALSQMTSFLSKMEEKSDVFNVSLQSPALLQSAQLQFLSGCFALGTQIIGSHTGTQYEMQHYMVPMSCNPFVVHLNVCSALILNKIHITLTLRC